MAVEPQRGIGGAQDQDTASSTPTPVFPRPRSGEDLPGGTDAQDSDAQNSEDGVDRGGADGYEPTLAYGGEEPPEHAGGHGRPWPSARQQIGTGVAVLGWVLAAFLASHRFLPDTAGLASLLETWLPWLAVPTALLLIAAAFARSLRGLLATGVAAAVWLGVYGPELFPRGDPLPPNLRVISEDVNASSVELAAVGQLAANQHADVVTLEHLPPTLASSPSTQYLNSTYGFHITQYEYGVWSRYKITDARAIGVTTTDSDTSNGATALVAAVPHVVVGALRVTVSTPQGPLVLYVVHIPQPVLGDQGFAKVRDEAVNRLVSTVAADHADKLAIVGDINVAQTDRRFTQLSSGLGLTSAQGAAGDGFGFTWPAEFPVVRLDDLLVRGATPVHSVVLPALAGGQTHLPIEIDLHL
ncbi:MAG TPA: endonuclease/exonuclease/phosphatase family protein [Actinocrinis sp.]|uniref:endonuclease/exonuclease/phosphatase family protein n=1 Tax=Actinocrinis sp. TaxID=1920516 RepID=UPI002DDD2317|nr:endonuclease/exonuclease/phosphatase family protein [Actinocrinis sp.]HEV2346055.1 endonuclease/exonuclease/phosphatase family protein [Actinocrinis sp.]